MFRAGLLLIIRGHHSLYTAICICRAEIDKKYLKLLNHKYVVIKSIKYIVISEI
jgi:hypothetical protein